MGDPFDQVAIKVGKTGFNLLAADEWKKMDGTQRSILLKENRVTFFKGGQKVDGVNDPEEPVKMTAKEKEVSIDELSVALTERKKEITAEEFIARELISRSQKNLKDKMNKIEKLFDRYKSQIKQLNETQQLIEKELGDLKE